MDAIDRFVRDGLFDEHSFRQIFEQGETNEERARWLEDVKGTCHLAGIQYVVREIREDGNPGYEFGFADATHYTAFVINVYGDLVEPGGHVHRQTFEGHDTAYHDAFRMAAAMHLAALGIKYNWREQNGELQFAFDRFSDRMLFQGLIEQGVIDASANGLAKARVMQRHLGLDPEPPPASPASGFEPA